MSPQGNAHENRHQNQPYKLPRGRRPNPLCPTCREEKVDLPEPRIGPGRKCKRHEAEYVGGHAKRWQQKKRLQDRRIYVETQIFQHWTLAKKGHDTEECLKHLTTVLFPEVFSIEKSLKEDYNFTTWTASPEKVLQARREAQLILFPVEPTDEDRALFEAYKKDGLVDRRRDVEEVEGFKVLEAIVEEQNEKDGYKGY